MLFSLIESLSLPIFLLYAALIDQQVTREWLGPYLASSLAAVISTVFLLSRKQRLNRIFIGINLYLFSGLVGVVFSIDWVNQLYGELGAAGMLIWVYATCLFFVFHKSGLYGYGLPSSAASANRSGSMGGANIDNESTDSKGHGLNWRRLVQSHKYNLLFLGVVLVACVISLLINGNRLLEEVLPFVMVFTAYSMLAKYSESRR